MGRGGRAEAGQQRGLRRGNTSCQPLLTFAPHGLSGQGRALGSHWPHRGQLMLIHVIVLAGEGGPYPSRHTPATERHPADAAAQP